MNDLATLENLSLALSSLEADSIDYIKQSESYNTKRAYDSDWQSFTEWADSYGLNATPAEPKTVALYITHMANSGYKVSTIQRALVAISKKHRASDYSSPAKHEYVRTTMKGIRRKLGTAKEGKEPLMTKHIRSWINTLGDNLLDTRNKALILIGFAGAFRRSELVALDVKDVEFRDQGVIIIIRKSKTDQEKKGRELAIPYQSPVTCPVMALHEWLEAAGIDHGPIFRGIHKGNKLSEKRLSDKTVSRVVKQVCETAGLDPDKYGAHSLRSGHITQATENGSSDASTKRQSGHKSQAVFESYIRIANLFKNNSANKLGL